MLLFQPKLKKKTEDDYYLKEFSQSYSLPKDMNLEELESKLGDDGVLVISAPLPKIEAKEEKQIPIKHEKLTQLK